VARLAALLWLLVCMLGAPGAATLHILSHFGGAANESRRDAPSAPPNHNTCEVCAAWHQLGTALPSIPPVLPALPPQALPPAAPAMAPWHGTAPRWFHPRAPPIQA